MSEPVLSRFLRLIAFDTQSSETSGLHPSTPGQKVLADALAAEFRTMGVSCRVTEQACLYAEIPATPGLEDLLYCKGRYAQRIRISLRSNPKIV